jgi:hypothetical protein
MVMQRLLSRVQVAPIGLLFYKIKIYIILKPPHFWGGFFFYICMEKEHQIFGIRAIIEAIQGTTVDKVYIQKMRVAN